MSGGDKKDYRVNAKFIELKNSKLLLNYVDVFAEIKILGRGTYGSVILVQDNYNNLYALKILHKSSFFKNEMTIIKNLSSIPKCDPDIVCYYDSFKLHRNGDKVCGILMEYVDGINLHDELIRAMEQDEVFSVDYIINISIWLTGVMSRLHKFNIVHRDIKLDNIMLITENDFVRPILIDFGFSCRIYNVNNDNIDDNIDDKYSKYSKCSVEKIGTFNYISPELINGDYRLYLNPNGDFSIKKFYKICDVYSTGVALFLIINGYYPYNIDDDGIIYEKNLPNDIEPGPEYDQSKQLNDIVSKMIRLDPTTRPSMKKIHQMLLKIQY